MLTAIEFEGKEIRFTDLAAQLPISKRGGGVGWFSWGRTLRSQNNKLPIGAWVTLEDIQQGKWWQHNRRPVKVPATRFCISKGAVDHKWFEVPAGKRLQAMLMRLTPFDDLDHLVFLVMAPAPPEHADVCTLWPRLV